MPKVYPFRGVHFDKAKTGDLTKVTTQPYDKIPPALQDEYARRHDHNIIRIIKRKEEPGRDRYRDSAETLKDWLKQGILVRDDTPSFYVYHQVYKAGGRLITRKGLSAMVQIQEPGKGKILLHEMTHSGPKIDRLNLLEATRTHTEQIFFLYSDPKKEVNAILDEASAGTPMLQATDDLGETHRVWKIDDPAKIRAIQKALDPRECIIADGHHRYETSWNFKQDCAKKGIKAEGAESPDNVLATLVNMDDDITIFGAHRLVYNAPGFDLARLLTDAKRDFDIREYPFANADEEKAARRELLEDLRIEGLAKPCFGVAAKESQAHYLFVVRDVKAAAAQVKEKRSEAWRSLDVCILTAVVLDGMLGVGKAQLDAEQCVEFLRSPDEAIDRARGEGKYQVAFLVNPAKMEQIKTLVKQGERFPHKTTDFYPKLLTGLLLCTLNIK